MQFEVADNRCVGYIFASVHRDIVVADNMEGVGPIDSARAPPAVQEGGVFDWFEERVQ